MAAEVVSRLVLLIFVCCFWKLPIADAVWMTLPSTGTKCVSEDIQRNVIVLGHYYAFYEDVDHSDKALSISVKVTSPYGNNLHHNDNVTHGEFAFTTTEAGYYVACFWLDGNHQEGPSVTLGIDWKIGIAAKDWESVAKKEKIEGVELELTKLQGAVEAIHDNLKYLKNREAAMREVSETTNARVAWFSIMAIGMCIVVSGVQLWYLKRFFQKKKLI